MGNAPGSKVSIQGYQPGAIGWVTRAHATYYGENWNFDVGFEAEVATELSDFLTRFDDTRDGFWLALVGEDIAGAIAIDGSHENNPDTGPSARLRWFILDPGFQGHGIGRALLDRAIDFSRDAGHARLYLWTFAGLDAARHLYEQVGFALVEEHADTGTDDKWGNVVTHQKFDLTL